MKKNFAIFFLCVLYYSFLQAQSAADSVTVTFCAYNDNSAAVSVPSEYSSWNSANAIMTYDNILAAWTRTYTFQRKANGRRVADSVITYKLYCTANSGDPWFLDPINSETAYWSTDRTTNSVLRMGKLFWFQFSPRGTTTEYLRITAGLFHLVSDSITNVTLSTGANPSSYQTIDVTANYNKVTGILDVALSTSIPKQNYIRLVGYNNLGDSIVYQQGGYVIQTQLLPSYAQHGVTLPSTLSGDSTTFRLRVPGKDYVLLHIAPLGQNPSAAAPIVMRKDTDNVNWWTNLKLVSGTYEYVYEIENNRMIYDPFGRWTGDYGSRFVIGSEGLTADDYVWQSTNYKMPPLNRLVIYELHIGEYAGGFFNKAGGQGTFQDLIATLPHLDSLGINAIELMPVFDYGLLGKSGHGWGYDPSSYFALEPAYGAPSDFKSLIDAAHQRNIAVIMDVVYNHMNDPGALWQMLPDETKNPYFKLHSTRRTNEQDDGLMRDLDHWSDYVQELVYTSMKMFIDQYRIDGFRLDYTTRIGWSMYDSTKGFIGWVNRIAREYPKVYIIAEHLPENPALFTYSHLTSSWHGAAYWTIFGERMENQSLNDIENNVVEWGAQSTSESPNTPNRYSSRTQPVNYTGNHDQTSIIYEMSKGTLPLSEIQQRDRLYLTYPFTSMGIPMLWEGMEWAEPRGFANDNQKLSYRPVQWNLQSTPVGLTHTNYLKALIFQRRFNPALFNGYLNKLGKFTSISGLKVLVYGFIDPSTGSRVMVLSNLGSAQTTLTDVPWLSAGNWYDIFDQSIYTAAGTTISSFDIPAYTAKVYSNKTNAELIALTGVEDNRTKNTLPTVYALEQNYPNPFNPTTTIEYQIPPSPFSEKGERGGFVSLTVYDLLGREVATLINERKQAGTYTQQWNAANLPSGVYFYRLKAGTYTETKKLVLLK
jgi:1,4-alpha-glucan branching enzyme